ncbi:NAD(P)-dependent oxidoreductase [Anaerobium acetethylicum]|uniref:Glutamate synthase (NADPH/NADH) small chain n=1 Tax=Anaerobium acetethylicum TaxID=1619234 RepID=A0A1D3TN85_9FIRM|nr:NAD(P)-dependent oxidoreductase [Anaerobium acetethylicum]SCP94766.1 glutamate synthase (NADPH/NADH) small chain [Anaerobium acetethylicum]
MAIHVIDEANRCLNCKKPLCREGCPINTPIPQMIQAFKNNKLNDAGEMLFENNPLSVVCSLVCDHDKQCEGHCILGKKGMPVHISSIENYISDSYFDKMAIKCAPANGRKVAIIGSGPAGITIAFYLAKMGYEITIFESREKIGGVMQYGIPEFRLPKSILDRYRKKLVQVGVKIRPNATIGGALEIEELLRDGYKSIFIGTGVWRPKKLGIKGESLGNVHFGIDYLVNPEAFDLGEKIAVIGLGNAAMDVARTALRHGAKQVTLYGRGQKPAANEHEVAYAKLDGAVFEFNKEIQEITDRGPVFKDVIRDEEGKFLRYAGDAYLEKADSVIISISQGPKNKLLLTTSGLEASSSGLLVTDESGETTRKGVFAAGDVVRGAKTVVEAAAYSKQVALAMHQYMEEQCEAEDRMIEQEQME